MNRFDATQYTFFLNGFLSNWYPCTFIDDISDYEYNCMEQYMMFKKAMLFGDVNIAKQILNATHPGICKRLGRQIKGFNEEVWNKWKYDIVEHGCYLKFSQNINLKNKLFNTKNTIIVECNPDDIIWGIGKSLNDPYLHKTEEWGENLLGKALMAVREDLRRLGEVPLRGKRAKMHMIDNSI